ncbi:MAG: STY0301 family protein [Methylocystis sp.]
MFSRPVLAMFAVLTVCATARAESCPPLKDKQPLASVDVFDGPVEEMADLVPDDSRSGRDHAHALWKLAHLYDEGHAVYVKCVYRGPKNTAVVKLARKVDKCVFDRTKDKPASMTCK